MKVIFVLISIFLVACTCEYKSPSETYTFDIEKSQWLDVLNLLEKVSYEIGADYTVHGGQPFANDLILDLVTINDNNFHVSISSVRATNEVYMMVNCVGSCAEENILSKVVKDRMAAKWKIKK